MTYMLEVGEDGTLTLPAEALSGAKPHTRFRVEQREAGMFLRPEEDAQRPLSWDDWWERWQALSEAISAGSMTDRSAVDILSEMRR